MRSISRIILTAILTVLVFTGVTYTACKKDQCKDVNCQNGGTCSNGICNCPTNYSGPDCEHAGPCAGISCQNGGICNNGNCTCPNGYEGTYCETEIRAKFIKAWSAADTNIFNSNPVTFYHPTISNGPTVNQVAISTINNGFFVHDVIGTIAGDSIIIASQQPDAGSDNYSISGAAGLVNGVLYWHYSITTTGTINYKGTWQ